MYYNVIRKNLGLSKKNFSWKNGAQNELCSIMDKKTNYGLIHRVQCLNQDSRQPETYLLWITAVVSKPLIWITAFVGL